MPDTLRPATAAPKNVPDTASLPCFLPGAGPLHSSPSLRAAYEMNKITGILLLLCVAGCATTTAYDPESHANWRLVAKSHIIATGTLSVPVELIRSCLASNEHDYVELTVTCGKALKGTVRAEFTVRWFTQPGLFSPLPEDVMALDGRQVLVFLTQVDNQAVSLPGFPEFDRPATTELYFAGYVPQALRGLDDGLVQRVQHEVAAQQRILAQFEDVFPPAEQPLYERVRGLIDATTRQENQMEAFRELEGLGVEAVPAIIMLMDDRRELAVPSISLRNQPGHWEAVRHYGPKKVVDAMAAILNQITGDSCGAIHNGGSERERTEAVNGWRIYLYYLKKQVRDKPLHSEG